MRGTWSLLLLAVLLGGGFAGCLSDDAPLSSQVPDGPPADLVPRRFAVDEAPAAFRFTEQSWATTKVVYRGSLQGNVSLPAGPVLREVARFDLDRLVPADVPTDLELGFVSQGWKSLHATIDCSECSFGRVSYLSDMQDIGAHWRIARPDGAAIWLVIAEYLGVADPTRMPSEWEAHLSVTPRPVGLAAGLPALVALDPQVPIVLDKTRGLDHLLIVHPERGLVSRSTARDGILELNRTLEPDLYVFMATGTGVVELYGGFSGRSVVVGVERVERDEAVSFDSQAVEWTEGTDRVPWGVGFVLERLYGIDPGESQWSIEWEGTQVYDSRRPGTVLAQECSFCGSRRGTDMSAMMLGAGEYRFRIDEAYGQGEAWAYFSYLRIDEALAAHRAGTGVDSV